MKLLVTRPAADAEPLARSLAEAGHEALIDPLLEIKPRAGVPPDLVGIQALLFTSANGVRAFAAINARRDLKVYAVGERTADAAGRAGFGVVESADGDVVDLVRLVAAKADRQAGALLHVSGTEVAGDLAGALTEAGFTIHTAPLYEAILAEALSPETRQAITDGALDGVLLFSPRTARQFATLIRRADLATERLDAWCLSQAVADAVSDLRFASVHVADEPTQAALLAAIGGHARKELDVIPDTPTEPAPSEPASPAPKRRGTPLWLWVALVILIALAVGAYAAMPYWRPLVTQYLRPSRNNTVAPARVAPPPDHSPAPAADGALDELRGAIAALNGRIDGLSARPSADPREVASLGEALRRIDATQHQLAERLDKVAAETERHAAASRDDRTLVLAAGQIRDAINGSAPFEAPVALIRAIAANDAALSQPLAHLEPVAKTGVPSRIVLGARLSALAPAVSAPPPPAADADIWQRMAARVTALVTVRRIDDGGGPQSLPPGPERDLAEAEQALNAGDLAGAVQAMHGIDNPAVKPWLDSATARLDAEQAANALVAEAVKRLSSDDGASDNGAAP